MCRILFSLLLIITNYHCHSASDSISNKRHHLPTSITYSSNASASYVNYKNWAYSGYNNFSFQIRENINYDSIGNKWEKHFRFNGELGYMKFSDSTWFKNNDYLDLSLEIAKIKGKRLTNTFVFYYNSQFLSSYENYINDSGLYTSKWVSGFGNPLSLQIGYGLELKFWKNCRIHFTYVTFKTSVHQMNNENPIDLATEMRYKNTIIQSEYGFGMQTFIRRELNSHIRIENYSRFFANAISRDHVEIDFRNKIIVKILKHLNLIFDSRIRYAPIPPYQFQFRNELMLSFSLEKY